MAGGFSFPPPPPPPVKAASEARKDLGNGFTDHGGRGRGRGRGRGGRGARGEGGRGRGRGGPYQNQWTNRDGRDQYQHPGLGDRLHTGNQQSQNSGETQHHPPGTFVNPDFGHPNGRTDGAQQPQPVFPQASAGPPRTFAGHKRKLDALRPPSRDRSQPKPPAAPAVPSFGAPILPSKPSVAPSPSSKPKAGTMANGLGLTPGDGDRHYSSDDDDGEEKEVDEEAMFAELGSNLTFEHNGVVMSLSSAADLAVWKEERRKNWPTRIRMSEKELQKRKTGRERRMLLAGVLSVQNATPPTLRRPMHDTAKVGDLSKKQSSKEDIKPPETELDRVRRELSQQSKKLEALRKHVSDSQTVLDKAQAEKEEREQQAQTSHIVEPDDAMNEDEMSSDGSEVSSILSESSVVSSDTSKSDGLDDDGPPEETTAKAPPMSATTAERPICKFYYASGHCQDGNHCRFRHKLGPGVQKASRPHVATQRDPHAPRLDKVDHERKSIYQRLMEQQEEEEDKLALKVIKYLATKALFEANVGMDSASSVT